MLVSPAKNKAGDWLLQGMVNPVLNCNSNFRYLDSVGEPGEKQGWRLAPTRYGESSFELQQ